MENKLTPLEYKGQRILTTKQLAEVYETDVNNIQKNFSNNKERFIEGKHYYKLTGNELAEFKKVLNDIHDPSIKFTSVLILWTERGADRHCKILDTDKAWEQFDNLEDTYFKVKEYRDLFLENEQLKEIVYEQKDLLNEFSKVTEEAKQLYKPSHKRKLQYDRLIKSVTSGKEEYDMVKEWIFAVLEAEKWEDISIDDNKKVLEIINTVSRMINIKRFEQLSLL
ncbi:ORF6N domain-containing protein [Clostridium butyricum]|uniref:ORF6N domain-containing protein n=1 Tax=Clostridium butyricum TaxID=1492 RepID=UPI0009044801|nr:ORF6N domain-containing protein [Clostridium butyricum]APF21312.1 hypothetical protein NPD4_3553 [Clostridium butyricum]